MDTLVVEKTGALTESRVDGHQVALGNRKLLEELGVAAGGARAVRPGAACAPRVTGPGWVKRPILAGRPVALQFRGEAAPRGEHGQGKRFATHPRRWADIAWSVATDMRREQSAGEEIANAISHGVGFAVSVLVAPILVAHAAAAGQVGRTVGACAFAASVMLLYAASTLYHALPKGGAKRFWRLAEHGGIYVLIAGTYTPFTLGVLHGAWGWTLLVAIWFLAVAGIAFKAVGGLQYPIVSTVWYVAMGWLLVIAAPTVWTRVAAAGIAWLVAGGLAYTVGVAFYAAKRLRFGHFIWHIFVLAGTTCHFFAVMWYAA